MPYSSNQLASLLRKIGFEEDRKRGKGSHRRFYLMHAGTIIKATTLPAKRSDIAPGTLGAVLRQVGLSSEDLAAVKRGELDRAAYLRRLGIL